MYKGRQRITTSSSRRMPFSLSSSSASAAGHSPTIQLSPIQALLVIIMCSATTLLVSQTLSYAESSSTAATAAHALLPPAPYPELDPSSSSRAASSSSSSSWASSNARDALSGPGTGQRRAITAAVSGGGTSSSGGRARASNERLPTSSAASAEGRDRGYPKRSDPGNSLRRFHDDIKMRGRTYLDGMEAQQADALGEDLASRSWPDPDITRMDPTLLVTRNGVTNPSVAWLMSFPNSGTSFTIHMTRDASNCTTATNYALEGDIRNLPSVPAIQGPTGKDGPFLELLRNVHTNVPPIILTKTHCTGYCSKCGPWKLLLDTPRSFLRGCLSGTRAVQLDNGTLVAYDTIYDASLVKKAIHIFRHPLDNIVARFHLEYNEMKDAGAHEFVQKFPKNATGFERWCQRSDKNRVLLESKYLDDDIKRTLVKVPCHNEFFKYVQWHNNAFYALRDLQRSHGLETMLLHYREYSENFEEARDKVLNFLELPRVGTPLTFHPGKEYRHYYTVDQKLSILRFVREYATPETWEQLEDYDFEIAGGAAGNLESTQ